MNSSTDNRMALNQSQGAGDEIDLSKLFRILWKRAWSIILFTGLCGALAMLFVRTIAPTYTASATLLLDSQQTNTVSIEDVVGVDNTKKEYFLTQIEILKSNQLAERVIAQLRLEQLPEFNGAVNEEKVGIISQIKDVYRTLPVYQAIFATSSVDFDPVREKEILRQRVLGKFKKQLSISSVGKTQLVRISFSSLDPKLAATVANTVGEAYIDLTMESRVNATQDANSWLTKRSAELKSQLANSEEALTDFLSKEGLIDASGIDSLTSNELTELNKRLSDARSRRVAAESIAKVLKNNKNTDIVSMASVSEIANHPQVKEMLALEIDAESRVNELAKRYGPKHDKMIQAVSQHKAVKKKSERFLVQLAQGIEQELRSVRQLEKALNREMEDKKDEFQDLAVQRARYDILKREVNTNRELFELFLTRQKETNATSDFTPISVRFTDYAIEPLAPSKPRKSLMVVLAALLGGMVSVACVLLLEVFRSSILSTRDFIEEFGLAPLGSVPFVVDRKYRRLIGVNIFNDDKHAQFKEAYISIRTSLVLGNLGNERKMYAVTSALPSEGKTTSSINLGLAMAGTERVLLIDTDLRRPSLGGRFGLDHSEPGLTHHILMDYDLDLCIHHNEELGIDVLPAGFIAPNPHQVLSSEKFKQVLRALENEYDKVIVDTPPILLFSDALSVLGEVGSGIVVSRANKTKKHQLKHVMDILFKHEIQLDGVILNGVKPKHEKGYGYYSEYKDYYKPRAAELR